MKKLLIPLLILAGCAPVQHREAFYGPSPQGVSGSDPRQLEDQISSVNAQLSGTDVQIATLDGRIAAMEKAGETPEQLAAMIEQRGALESQHSALLTRKTRLQALRNSAESRATVPLQ